MKKNNKKKSRGKISATQEFDREDMLIYMKMSPREKLDYLERMNLFLNKITPTEVKIKQQRLKNLGF